MSVWKTWEPCFQTRAEAARPGLWYCLAAVVLVGAAALSSCSGRTAQSATRPAAEAVPVSVAPAVSRGVPIDIRVVGNVEPYSTISVKAQVNGELMRVYFREGDYVKQGETLFLIDPRPFEAQIRQIEANLERDSAQARQAEANLARDVAQQGYYATQEQRYAELVKKGVLSRQQYDQASSDARSHTATVEADRSAIETAKAAIQSDRAALESAKLQLSYCTIRSPLTGRTGNQLIKQGNVVKANDADLVKIHQVQPVYVTFSVPEAQLPAIKARMAVHKLAVLATPQGQEGEAESGVLTFVDNEVDPTTGTIRLKATFANAGRKLWPGQFVRVVLNLDQQRDAVVVPLQAIQAGQEGPFVFVVRGDFTVEDRRVTTGVAVDQEIVVSSGLRAGETVVTEGQLRLTAGTRIQVKGAQPGAPGAAGRAE